MARKPFVAGNWKMYTTAATGQALASTVAKGVEGDDRVTVCVCPPFPYLPLVAAALNCTKVAVGAQNLYPAAEGAYTGEVSPAMIKDAGANYVILGHSERRHTLKEKDDFINRKVHCAVEHGLKVILCVGETLAERESGRTEAVLQEQLTHGLVGLTADKLKSLVVAYEPVWAIGTGLNATPDQAQVAHAFLRKRYAETFTPAAADALTIVYGGSVKPENAASILGQPDVDGALVGGASLKPESFLAIVKAAVK